MTTLPTIKQREPDPVLAFYTPDRILDLAYCYSLVSTNGDDKRPVLQIALSTVHDFEKIYHLYNEELLAPEWKFLTCQKAILVSLSRGIERRRHDLQEQKKRALDERNERMTNLTFSRTRIGLLKALYRSLVFGGFGYVLARMFIPWMNFDKPVQPTIASLATGLVFIIGTMLVGMILLDRRMKLTALVYDTMILNAQAAYRRGAKEEYLRAKRDAARVWTQYVGREPTNWPGYETILEEEQELAEMIQAERRRILTNPLVPIALGALTRIGKMTTKFGRKELQQAR
jgi:hypothetical protein